MRRLCWALCFLASACGSSPTAATAARVDPHFAAWNRPDSPGCGVGVSRNGAVIYEHGYGMASLERKVPITSSTVFHLASITKPFTAMSVLLAAERGLLSLDDDVSKYIRGRLCRHGPVVRDARGAVAAFTLNRNSARGVRFERVKAG